MFSLSALLIELFPEAIFEEIVDVYPVVDFPEAQSAGIRNTSGKFTSGVDPKKDESHKIEFSKKYIENLLGLEVSDTEIEDILKRYKFEYSKSESNFSVSIPPMRLDLTNREDMAEEMARIIGYDKIPARLDYFSHSGGKPVLPMVKGDIKENEIHQKITKARSILVENGYLEVMTYAFANTGVVEVLASASDKKFLRTNLSDGLKESYELNKLNAPYLNLNEIKIFEIGTVFTKNGEEMHVAYVNKNLPAQAGEIKEVRLDEFEKSFLQVLEPTVGNTFSSRLNPLSGGSDADSEKVLPTSAINYFKMWSLYPYVTRDIACWVPENISADELAKIYHEFGTELLVQNPILVDTFKKPARSDDHSGGDDKISYAFRLVFQSYDRTLTTEEINLIMSKITEKLSSLGYIVR